MIFENIDDAANKLAPIFKTMGWTWLDSEIPPSKDDIKKIFTVLKKHLETSLSSRTGRLFSEKTRDTKKIIYGLERSSEIEWIEYCECNLVD